MLQKRGYENEYVVNQIKNKTWPEQWKYKDKNILRKPSESEQNFICFLKIGSEYINAFTFYGEMKRINIFFFHSFRKVKFRYLKIETKKRKKESIVENSRFQWSFCENLGPS